MKVLAIETACAACSAAIWADGAIAASRFQLMDRGQAEALMPMVQQVVDQSRVGFDTLDLVAVTVGPGSFTGLRTGLAAARGIALARRLPVFGVTTLEAVALAGRRMAPEEARHWPVTVVLNSRRRDLYVQQFNADLVPTGAPCAALPDAIAALLPRNGVILAGDAADQIIAAGSVETLVRRVVSAALPDAALVAEIAAGRWSGDAAAGIAEAAPLYLRQPEATRPVAGGRLRP